MGHLMDGQPEFEARAEAKAEAEAEAWDQVPVQMGVPLWQDKSNAAPLAQQWRPPIVCSTGGSIVACRGLALCPLARPARTSDKVTKSKGSSGAATLLRPLDCAGHWRHSIGHKHESDN